MAKLRETNLRDLFVAFPAHVEDEDGVWVVLGPLDGGC